MIDYKALIANLFKAANVVRDVEKSLEKNAIKPERVYRDEPIKKRSIEYDKDIPAVYREMRKIADSSEALRQSDAWLFYHQGKFIEKIVDNKEYKGSFVRYNPTYQLMTNDQLRGYITWRTLVREGNVREAPVAFAYLYVYELINLIGVNDPAEGFKALCKFRDDFGIYDASLERYISTWICDFAAFYNVERDIVLAECSGKYDNSLIVLKNTEGKSDEEVFEAISQLSSYKIEKSRFAKDYRDDVVSVCRRFYDQYAAFYDKNRKRTLFESLFGTVTSFPYYRMFSNAVFYNRTVHTDFVYEINSIRRYSFSRGFWSKEAIGDSDKKSTKLGEITKSIDAIMRSKYGYKYPIKYECPTKQLASFIEKIVDAYLKEKQEKAVEAEKQKKPEIIIDLSKLGSIRAAADITRDKLIVEESEDEKTEFTATEDVVSDNSEELSNETVLDDNEYKFVHMLLYGGDACGFASGKKLMVSVLIDSINEKLYDIFCDTVIDYDGVEPTLIEDYIEDLKGIVK